MGEEEGRFDSVLFAMAEQHPGGVPDVKLTQLSNFTCFYSILPFICHISSSWLQLQLFSTERQTFSQEVATGKR